MLTTLSNTPVSSAGSVLATSGKQWVTTTSGFLSLTLLTKPLMRPTMAAAPSVQTPTQLSFVRFLMAHTTHWNTHVHIWRRHRTHTHTHTHTLRHTQTHTDTHT